MNRVLLPSERAGQAEPRTAMAFGPGGDAGILLFLGQGVTDVEVGELLAGGGVGVEGSVKGMRDS